MPDKHNKETVQKIINAIERPNNPERKAAIALQEQRQEKQHRLDQIPILAVRLSLIALFVAILVNAWSDNDALPSRWTSLILGLIMGTTACIVIQKLKRPSRKSISLSASLLVITLVIVTSLLISGVKPFMPAEIMASITISGSTFLLIVSTCALLTYYRDET